MIRWNGSPFVDRLRRHAPKLFMAASAIGLGAGGALSVQAVRAAVVPNGGSINSSDVRAALRLRLPRTPIGTIDCRRVHGLCEVIAGSSLFYVDRTARFLVIGHVYDMEQRSDLTAARLLEIDPAKLVPTDRRQAEDLGSATPVAQPAAKVDLAELPSSGAITWGVPDGRRIVVLSDFACGYCRKLTGELAKLPLRIEERPISIFGPSSRRKAEQVLCASNPATALHAAYREEPLPPAPKCDMRGLDANEAFARRHGFGGTPVMIRADGAVLAGYRPAAVIQAFIDGKSS